MQNYRYGPKRCSEVALMNLWSRCTVLRYITMFHQSELSWPSIFYHTALFSAHIDNSINDTLIGWSIKEREACGALVYSICVWLSYNTLWLRSGQASAVNEPSCFLSGVFKTQHECVDNKLKEWRDRYETLTSTTPPSPGP